ncbi:MAG: gamma carbonic anhydrase family protein [Myxococcota bacterium]
MDNLIPFPLSIAANIDKPHEWLEKQNERIKAVTYIDQRNFLMQKPVVSPEAWVDPTALIIGGVIIRKGCYIAPHAVIRLDENDSPEPLVIDDGTNIQDGAIVHAATRSIGKEVIVAHQAVVHGAIVEDEVTLYIQTVVDGGGTIIGKGSFLHYGTYVGKGIQILPDSYLAPGVRVLTQAQADNLPKVNQELRELRKKVMNHNHAHCKSYLTNRV